MVAWAAGLFEGEGTFAIDYQNGHAKGLSITSTDRDVLERIMENFGGSIYNNSRVGYKTHWKDSYKWIIRSSYAEVFCKLILPYLCKRRKQKAEEWLKLRFEKETKNILTTTTVLARKKDMIELRKQGKTHSAIAEQLGSERSHVSKTLKRLSSSPVYYPHA